MAGGTSASCSARSGILAISSSSSRTTPASTWALLSTWQKHRCRCLHLHYLPQRWHRASLWEQKPCLYHIYYLLLHPTHQMSLLNLTSSRFLCDSWRPWKVSHQHQELWRLAVTSVRCAVCGRWPPGWHSRNFTGSWGTARTWLSLGQRGYPLGYSPMASWDHLILITTSRTHWRLLHVQWAVRPRKILHWHSYLELQTAWTRNRATAALGNS